PLVRLVYPAAPPDLPAATGRHVLGCKVAVLGRVPLGGKFRMGDRQGFFEPSSFLGLSWHEAALEEERCGRAHTDQSRFRVSLCVTPRGLRPGDGACPCPTRRPFRSPRRCTAVTATSASRCGTPPRGAVPGSPRP